MAYSLRARPAGDAAPPSRRRGPSARLRRHLPAALGFGLGLSVLGCQVSRPADAYEPLRVQEEPINVVEDPPDVIPEVDSGPPPPAIDEVDAGAGSSLEQQLQGDYFMRIQSVASDRDFQLGTVNTTGNTYAIVALRLEGGVLTATEQWCYMEFDVSASSGSISTTVPPAVPQTTPAVKRTFTVDEAAGAFTSSAAAVAMGFHDDGGALPTSTSDSRVYDQDQDGTMGVAMRTRVSAGAINADCTFHIVRRVMDTFSGNVVGDALGDGVVQDQGGGQWALSAHSNGGGFGVCDEDDANDRDPVIPTSNNVRFVKVDPIAGFGCPARADMINAF